MYMCIYIYIYIYISFLSKDLTTAAVTEGVAFRMYTEDFVYIHMNCCLYVYIYTFRDLPELLANIYIYIFRHKHIYNVYVYMYLFTKLRQLGQPG